MSTDEDTKKLLLAMVIGDGHITKRRNTLSITHSGKQAAYCEGKAKLLETVLDRTINIHPFNNGGYDAVRFEIGDKRLKNIRKSLYPDGTKKLTLETLNDLTDQGVAIWYQDDGSLHNKKRDDKVCSKELTISTCFETREEAQTVCDFFKGRYDSDMTVKLTKGRFSVRCGLQSARKIIPHLESHCFPGMEHKFDLSKRDKSNEDFVIETEYHYNPSEGSISEVSEFWSLL